MAVKKNYLVEKRNVLNELRANNMSLPELRFFSIYLAKINPRNLSTRLVSFTVSDFKKIMEFDSNDNIAYLKQVTDSLLSKIVHIPLNEPGAYTAFQLFKKCTVKPDASGEWSIEIDAHDDALPLMFEFKERYFSYELWNALKLKSSNQLRMYEILKQYEYVGERIIGIDELKELLGIDREDYVRYDNLKSRVLNSCQKALSDYTDITFTYEPIRKKGRGGKIVSIKFIIQKNNNYVDQLCLEEFINQKKLNSAATYTAVVLDENEDDDYFEREIYPFMADACQGEFNSTEIQVLYNLVVKVVPYKHGNNNETAMYDYLKHKYDELNWKASMTEIKNRMGYLKKLIEIDLNV